jgi:hypothetical protein
MVAKVSKNFLAFSKGTTLLVPCLFDTCQFNYVFWYRVQINQEMTTKQVHPSCTNAGRPRIRVAQTFRLGS